MGCRVFKGGIQNEMEFWPKINIPKGNYCILKIHVVDITLDNKVILRIEVKIDSESQILTLFENFQIRQLIKLNIFL